MTVITAGQVYKVVYAWSGFSGQPGATVLHFDASTGTAQQAADAGRAFLFGVGGAAVNNYPLGVKITSPTVVDTLDIKTGFLVTSTSVTPPAVITGNGSGPFSSATGACVGWQTGDFKPTKPPAKPGISRVQGRTFIVPTSPTNTFDATDGTLSTAFVGTVQSSITTLLAASPKLVIWSRPTPPAGTDGTMSQVTGGKINDKTAILTSRRD